MDAQDIKPAKVQNNKESEFVRNLRANELAPILPHVDEEKEESAVNDALITSIVNYSKKFLGSRYKSGGKGPKVFDCSGFVGFVWRNFGFKMGDSSRDQYLQGKEVTQEKLKPGDLLFFGGRSRGRSTVGHVGMVVSIDEETSSVRFIHASTSGGVKIDRFPDGGYYSARFIGAKRIID